MTLILHAELRYRYPSGWQVGPVALALGPGVHHLRGANGSGKTTVLRCLCGELRRSEGTLTVGGGDPRDPGAEGVAARRRVARLAAEPELPDVLTVDEAWQQLAALRGAPGWDGERVRRRLDVPGGLPLGHCSAGQRKLGELLAALAGDPDVLLLDEPFANLDPDHRARVVDMVEGLRADRVIVLTTHGPPPLAVDSEVWVGRAADGAAQKT